MTRRWCKACQVECGIAAGPERWGSLVHRPWVNERVASGTRRSQAMGRRLSSRVATDRDRRHYRLFCVRERDGARFGLGGPSIVVITGMEKPFRTTFTERDYAHVRQIGD